MIITAKPKMRNTASINIQGGTTGPQAGQVINNNRVALSSTFTQNGQTKTVGAIDLEANNFFTVFPPQVVDNTGTPIAITPQAQGLPQMNGAGMVRDMRAAASLDGGFAAALTAFAAGITRDEQRGILDELVFVKALRQSSIRMLCNSMRLQRGWHCAMLGSFHRAQSRRCRFDVDRTQRKDLLGKSPIPPVLHV